MTRPMGRALLGAVSGFGATVAMSGVMLAARRLIGRQPPEQIVETSLDVAGVPEPDEVEPVINTLAVVAHLGYGSLLGALFALARPRHVSLLSGLAFGLLVWVANYAGVLPAAGIMPRPWRDRPGRQPAIVASHLVYGSALSAMLRRLRRP
jgi:uncharacterized membrane protein YagU involved in acid resistance